MNDLNAIEPLLGWSEVTKIVNRSRSTLYEMINKDRFPRPIYVLNEFAGFDPVAIRDWQANPANKSKKPIRRANIHRCKGY